LPAAAFGQPSWSAFVRREAIRRAMDVRGLDLANLAIGRKSDLYTQQAVIGVKPVARPVAHAHESRTQETTSVAEGDAIDYGHFTVFANDAT